MTREVVGDLDDERRDAVNRAIFVICVLVFLILACSSRAARPSKELTAVADLGGTTRAMATDTSSSSRASSPAAPLPCPLTQPNGSTPPGVSQPCPDCLGNGRLWVTLPPGSEILFAPDQPNSPFERKFPWWRGPGVEGKLTIEGRRLDASAAQLGARIPEGYGEVGFQSTEVIFPTPGCWEVTGRVGDASLTFVIRVIGD